MSWWTDFKCKVLGHDHRPTGDYTEDTGFVGEPGFGVAQDDAIFEAFVCSRCGDRDVRWVAWGTFEDWGIKRRTE
jgi:hypothetical protein